ncbi:Histidine phosphatase superfamily, clade-1 [Cynara cardunculus var. scolymus]|uniref:Histidine phosphatase superfamily, clade-1 n=1 Tax=Cynara cardunculus var. scolymus TaxID=59895 RepID=A0A118JUJ5_CYNCS|nr:Histidine phosphatase superfamily, clade-1 [Cynara cardunculus var. scolymus]
MSTLRTRLNLESTSVSLPPRHNPLKLLNLHGANKELRWRRRTQFRSFSVALRPIPPPTAVFFLMADTHSSGDADLNSVDRTFTEVVVVRHGETEWNAEKRIQGHLDIDLNDVGRQQAVAVAERLSGESNISAIYSSDLKRALETAQTIASRCGGLEVIQDPNLRERHLGDLQGLVYSEAPKIKTKAYEALQSHRKDVEIPGGGERERVVVVTHGGVIRALHQRASLGNGRRAGRILNVSVNVFHLSDPDKWDIKVWGDVGHLNGANYLDSGFGGDRTSG